jgi:aspartyl-tRNA(Asn)/glutamyl-tRNA(Gln) amidotransferase subunit C
MAKAEVTEQECEELARLARLSLTPDQVQRFSRQIGQIVGYLQQLASVDVTDVPEYAPVQPARAPLRPDVAGPTLTRAQVLEQAPVTRGDHVAVPKFKED